MITRRRLDVFTSLTPCWYKGKMDRSLRHALAFALLLTAVLSAQPPVPTDATVGVPYTLDFGSELRGIPTSIEGVSFTYSFTAAGGLPPGLSLKQDGLLSGTPTTPGQYSFTITLSFVISAPGIPA